MTTRHTFPQNWTLGMHKERRTPPEEWVPATVPGAVQLDWGQAHQYPDYVYSDNYKQYRWMEDVYWTYRAELTHPPLQAGQRLFFVCGGVDYRFQVGLDDALLHDREGMFTPVELELTQIAKAGSELWVCVYPVPKSFTPDPDWDDLGALRTQANRSCKPAVSYGWDFHPRLVPLGIWQDTYLEVRPAAFLRTASLDYRLNAACDLADITVAISIDGDPAGSLQWELLDPDGQMVLEQTLSAQAGVSQIQATLPAPRLWWPHDQGQPHLYTSHVTLHDDQNKAIDVKQQRIGFRRVRLVMNHNAWKHPVEYPKSRSHAPMTLEINGRRIFAKGSNWVSPQIFPGLLNRQSYEIQFGFAKEANMNMLRCWGGAPVMKESFFEIADELGLMIWQEFPLACNDYPDDPAYLKVLDRESRSIIQQLKHHPCLVLWCGGNELFNEWSGMDDQSLPLRLLGSNCYQLDPQRPFIMTSPLNGATHGSYWLRDRVMNIESWALFQDSACTAYCEFSCGSSLRPVETLRRFIPEDELFPSVPHPSWVAHCAFDPNMEPIHVTLKIFEQYFGPSATIEELIERSQFLHAQTLRGMYEEVRRQKMEASMALNWCFNEPWPNVAGSGNMITWDNKPLPVFYAVRDALRPVLASARIRKLQWQAGELFAPELWVLSDAPHTIPVGRMEVWLQAGDLELFLLEWNYPALEANTNMRGPKLQITLPDITAERFNLLLKVPECPEMSSAYILLVTK